MYRRGTPDGSACGRSWERSTCAVVQRGLVQSLGAANVQVRAPAKKPCQTWHNVPPRVEGPIVYRPWRCSYLEVLAVESAVPRGTFTFGSEDAGPNGTGSRNLKEGTGRG